MISPTRFGGEKNYFKRCDARWDEEDKPPQTGFFETISVIEPQSFPSSKAEMNLMNNMLISNSASIWRNHLQKHFTCCSKCMVRQQFVLKGFKKASKAEEAEMAVIKTILSKGFLKFFSEIVHVLSEIHTCRRGVL